MYKVIYAIIKVRGLKPSVMYFPNDVSLFSPLVHSLRQYDECGNANWESLYVILYWIHLLLLSPFDIATIQEEHEDLISDLSSSLLLFFPRNDPVGDINSLVLARFLARCDCPSRFMTRRDVMRRILTPSLTLFETHLRTVSSSTYNTAYALYQFLKLASIDDMTSEQSASCCSE